MDDSHKKHRPHIKVGKDSEEEWDFISKIQDKDEEDWFKGLALRLFAAFEI